MKIIDIQQSTPEWLSWRKQGLGASDSATVLGINPWKSPYKLWSQLLGFEPPEPENEAMREGKRNEAAALEMYCALTGYDMKPMCCEHDRIEWLRCSMDGFECYYEPLTKELKEGDIVNRIKRGVEIKCGKKSHELARQGQIPPYYVAQIMHQYAVTGASQIDYFSFDGSEGIILSCPRDEAYIENLINKEQEFWNCVQNLEPPPLTEKDYVKSEDETCIENAKKLFAIQQKISELEKEAKELKNQLVSASASKNIMYGALKFSKSYRRGNVQYTKIPELKDVDLEKYRAPTIEIWRLSGGI